jgi:hypothetical protein
MSESYPLVELVVVLITDGESRFLVDYNEPWGCFTFPSTKLHDPGSTMPPSREAKETPDEAAARATAEVLGRPLDPSALTKLPEEVPPWNQSGRDGQWKRYTVHLFGLNTKMDPKPLPGHTALWLTRKELETLEPVSPTVRSILRVVA